MFFEKQLRIRCTVEAYDKVRDTMKLANKGLHEPKYENPSHFIRCAISKLVREETELAVQREQLKRREAWKNPAQKTKKSLNHKSR